MTAREQEVMKIIEESGGSASPTAIGREMGVSPDYAEQLCRHLVWLTKLYRRGRHFEVRTTKV